MASLGDSGAPQAGQRNCYFGNLPKETNDRYDMQRMSYQFLSNVCSMSAYRSLVSIPGGK
jgi:hypothetical protein